MRSYPHNSGHAAARIVALAALADGNLSQAELDTLDRGGMHRQLGLQTDEWHAVVHGLCEDLLATAAHGWGAACKVDPDMLAALLGEVDDPALQRKLIALCVDVVDADAHVADGELVVLRAAIDHWRLAPDEPPGVAPSTTALAV